MQRPQDLADSWDKLREQEPKEVSYKGSQGIREYFKQKGIEVAKKKEPQHIDEIDVKTAPDDTKVWVELGLLKEALKEAVRLGEKRAEARIRKEYEHKALDRKKMMELISNYT